MDASNFKFELPLIEKCGVFEYDGSLLTKMSSKYRLGPVIKALEDPRRRTSTWRRYEQRHSSKEYYGVSGFILGE